MTARALVLYPLFSQAQPLASAPVTFAGDPAAFKARLVRVWSNRQHHLAIGDTASTTDTAFAADGDGALIHLDPGEALSCIKGDGQPDGTVWFTVVNRY